MLYTIYIWGSPADLSIFYIVMMTEMIGFSKIWRVNIYNVIKKLRDSNGIKWLRMRMSYHRFPNLGELLQEDLVSKIRRNLASKDFLDR